MPDQARQRTSAEDRGEAVGSSTRVHISFSAGLAHRNTGDELPQDILNMADKALCDAKRAGRARVCCYAES